MILGSSIKLIDTVNDENSCEVRTIHDEVCEMRICPNGKYLITGGNKGDVALYSLKKVEFSAEEASAAALMQF